MIKLQIPSITYREMSLQECPLCGGMELSYDTDETHENFETLSITGVNVVNVIRKEKAYIVCNRCGLRADILRWNDLTKKETS